MYEKIFDIKTRDKCNYAIDISQNNNNIFLSLNEQGYILSKEKFLSLEEKNLESSIRENSTYIISDPEDTIATSKFTSDGEKIILGDQTKTITKYNLTKNVINTDNNEIKENTNNNNENEINNDVNNKGTKKITDKKTLEIKKLKTWKFGLGEDNNTLITGANNIYVYDLENNKIIKEIESRNKFIYSFCFLPEKKISIGNSIGSVQIYDLETGNQIQKFEEHCLLVRNLAYNKRKNILYTASDDLHINQIHINTIQLDSPIIGHKEPISGMIYNEEKNLLFTSSFDGVIKTWDTNGSNNCISTLELNSKWPIWAIAISKNADFICYTSSEGIGAYLLK